MDIYSTCQLVTTINETVPEPIKVKYGLLIVMIVLILLSGFFSMSETVYSTANKVKLQIATEDGVKGARKALWITEHFERALTTLLVGNNIVNITLATVSVGFFTALLVNHTSWIEFTSTAVITVLVLIFGEIFPKTIGKAKSDTLAIHLSWIIYVLMIILYPIVMIFYGLQYGIKKRNEDNEEPQVNEEELEVILDTMEEEGAIESDEVDLINNILDLNDREVKDIMTPCIDCVIISDDMDIEDVKKLFLKNHYSRVPVYHENQNNIIGILFEREFYAALINKKNVKIKSLLKPAKFVSKSMKVDDVLREFQTSKMHMAIVSGEYGEFAGIVTLEDALEELVGEIYDEHDEEDPKEALITKLEDDVYEINAEMYLEDLFEELDLGNPPETQYSKLSGWLYGMCEDIPEEGYNLTYISKFIAKDEEEDSDYEEKIKKLTFVVTKVEERRIITVRLYVEEIEDEDELENEGQA